MMANLKTPVTGMKHIPAGLTIGAFLALIAGSCADTKKEEVAGEKVTDEAITVAVASHLDQSDLVAAHLVDVAVNDGVVALTGAVDNLLARDQAVRIARSYRGVRSVVDKLDVEAVPRNDREIGYDVLLALGRDPVAESFEVEVNVENGRVILDGTVDSWAESLLVENIIKKVRGVKGIDNRLTIDTQVVRTSPQIKAEIEKRLKLDPHVPHETIEVDVKGTTAILSGVVRNLNEKTHAVRDARVRGIAEVEDDSLVVSPRGEQGLQRGQKVMLKSDEEIAAAVRDALAHDPRTMDEDIEVDVDDWEVRLSGMVDNLAALRAARRHAANTVGVLNVVNRLKVRPGEVPSDRELETAIREGLAADPIAERHEIEPVVRNAAVFLYGTVDSYYERAHAEAVVAGVKGVVIVHNQLEVAGNWASRSDKAIENDIRASLRWNALLEAEDIDVEVEDGLATLTGDVGSWFQLTVAVDQAFDGGARTVRSRLHVAGRYEANTTFSYWDYPLAPNL